MIPQGCQKSAIGGHMITLEPSCLYRTGNVSEIETASLSGSAGVPAVVR